MAAAAAVRYGARPATLRRVIERIERLLPYLIAAIVILLIVAVVLSGVLIVEIVFQG